MIESLANDVAEHARREPQATALIWDGRPIGYGELQEMAARAQSEIERLGLPEDRPVGIRAKKSPEAIALILGCLAARRAFLLPSVELPGETLDRLFAQARASRVLSPSAGDTGAVTAEEVSHTGDETSTEPLREVGAGEVSFMLTTSGSTGLPKIVPLKAEGIDRFTQWAAGQFEIRPGTSVINYAPLNFDLCLLDIWTTLRFGGTVVLVDQERATQGAYLADLIEHDVNVVQAVPMLYRLLIDLSKEQSDLAFPSVRHVISTGDKIPATSLAALPGLFPNARMFNIYGCTETNDSLMHEFEGLAEGNVPANVPLGRPLPGVSAMIQDEDGEFLEGPGTGELLVWTPFQTDGYLVASLNEGKFVTLPGDNDGGKRYYRGGDIVRRHEDGTITLEGRRDFYVKVRGVRVSTQVVEQAIQEHPDVIEVAVVPVPDEMAGALLHARVRRDPDSKLNSLGLRKHCSTRLARTEMPSTIEIVTEELPKTSTGKIDRKRCFPKAKEAEVSG